MRYVLIGLALVFVGSLSLNAIQYHKLDAAGKTIAELQAQNAELIKARNADHAAIKTAAAGRALASENAKDARDALYKADMCLDDVEFLDALARMWQERAEACTHHAADYTAR